MENTKELYACAYKEVITILSCLPDEEWFKIPKERRDFYFESMKKDYKFELDSSKPIYEQKLLKPTRAILANIFKDYLASPNQKEEIIYREQKEFEKIEEEKRNRYNPDDIFKRREHSSEVQEINLPVEVKKESFFKKIINNIKKLFKK